jgi:hypothetical protein
MTVRRCMTRDVTCNQRYLHRRTNIVWRVVMPHRKDKRALMETTNEGYGDPLWFDTPMTAPAARALADAYTARTGRRLPVTYMDAAGAWARLELRREVTFRELRDRFEGPLT